MIQLNIKNGKLNRKVKPFGSGAHVIAPSKWTGEEVILISPRELRESEAEKIIIIEDGTVKYKGADQK